MTVGPLGIMSPLRKPLRQLASCNHSMSRSLLERKESLVLPQTHQSPLVQQKEGNPKDKHGDTALHSAPQEESYETIEVQLECLGRPLGSGGSGQVFQYQWEKRQIAIKIFSDKATLQKELQAYCLAASSSIHNHLPRFYGRARLPDYFTLPNRLSTSTKPFTPYCFGIAFELIQGIELHLALAQLSNDRLQGIEDEVQQVLKDLRDECGIIHGDVRVQNLLITQDSWTLVDLGNCGFRATLSEKQWLDKSRHDDALCYAIFRDAKISNAVASGFKLLQTYNPSSPSSSSTETQLLPLLITIERRPSQAIPFIDFVLTKIQHPTPQTSHILAQILRLLGRFNDASAQIVPHISNASTPLPYQSHFHNHRVAIAEARIKARRKLNMSQASSHLLAALTARIEAFTNLHGKTGYQTLKARHALWVYFFLEAEDLQKAGEVYEETRRVLREEGGKVGKGSEERRFCIKWEKQRMYLLERRKKKRL